MMMFHQSFEPMLGNMRIDLGGREIRVTQHELHRPEIGAIIHQMSRKCMTERVG